MCNKIITNNKKRNKNLYFNGSVKVDGVSTEEAQEARSTGMKRTDGEKGRESIVEQRILCSEYGRRGWLTNERKRKNVYSGGGGGVGDWSAATIWHATQQWTNRRRHAASGTVSARSFRLHRLFSIPRALYLDRTGSQALTPYSTIRPVSSKRRYSTRTSF